MPLFDLKVIDVFKFSSACQCSDKRKDEYIIVGRDTFWLVQELLLFQTMYMFKLIYINQKKTILTSINFRPRGECV